MDDFLLGFVLGIVIAIVIVVPLMNNSWEDRAIKSGCAHYDSKTAAFKWSN